MEARNSLDHSKDELINLYELSLYPASAGVIGAINSGFYCGVIGFTLGFIDAISINYKIYNKPYLTSGIFGIAMFSPFKYEIIGDTANVYNDIEMNLVNLAIDTIGFSVGAIYPSKIFVNNINILKPLMEGVFVGYSYEKIYNKPKYGAITGFALAGIEALCRYGKQDNEYILIPYLKNVVIIHTVFPFISNTMLTIGSYSLAKIDNIFVHKFATLASEFIANNINYEIFSHNLALVMCKYSDQDKSKENKYQLIELNEELCQLYEDVIPASRINDLFYKQMVALVATKLIILKIGITLEFHKSKVYVAILKIWNVNGIEEFVYRIKAMGMFFVPYLSGYISDGFINWYFKVKIRYHLEQYFDKGTSGSDSALYLAKNNYGNAVIQKDKNIEVVVENGVALLADGMSTVISGVYAINYLYNNNIDVLRYARIYNHVISPLTLAISSSENNNAPEIIELSDEISQLARHAIDNAISNAESGKSEATRKHIEIKRAELNNYKELKDRWSILNNIWITFKVTWDFMMSYWVVGFEIKNNPVLENKVWSLITLMSKVSKMVGWEASNSGKLKEFTRALLKLKDLKSQIITSQKENDNIQGLNYSYKVSDKVGFCLNNFIVGVNEDSRISVKNLCVFDKIISISGESGCGKSTFLKLFNPIKHTGVWGKGEITYYTKTGNAVKIFMMSQNENFLPGASLLELITSKPGIEAKANEKIIKDLLSEIKIDNVCDKDGAKNLSSRLNENAKWEVVLSGGQKQKILFISIVFKILNNDMGKPDFIIFDEVFKAMDTLSIKNTQSMIIKYMGDVNILIVDHHAKNSNDFYLNHILFQDNTMILANDYEVCEDKAGYGESEVEYLGNCLLE